jgi:hypothetical protein
MIKLFGEVVKNKFTKRKQQEKNISQFTAGSWRKGEGIKRFLSGRDL